jgi:aspartyl-tRNA(Asn)/glutamyl-tRNA(Gln) amidotransferase subunit C
MIHRATVEKIAHLARLEINSSEEEQFAGQLSGILDYFEQLSGIRYGKCATHHASD